MEETQRQALDIWKQDTKNKLRNGCSSKEWWKIVQCSQGTKTSNELPPLNVDEKMVAFSNKQKAEAFADFYENNMTVSEPNRLPPKIPRVTENTFSRFYVEKHTLLKHLKELNVSKATGPDNISPRILKECASAVAEPISIILNQCILNGQWPKAWKSSFIVPVHKKRVCFRYQELSSRITAIHNKQNM